MTYISAQVTQDRQSVIVWERDAKGNRDFRAFRAPYYFYYPDPEGNGPYKDIHGNTLAKMEFTRYRDFNDSKQQFAAHGIRLYESDIGPEFKVLSEHYYGKPSGKLNVTFLDIEVDYDKQIGFSTVDNPYAPISAISLYHQYNDTFVVYAVPPTPDWTEERVWEVMRQNPPKYVHDPEFEKRVLVVLCNDEKELLTYFIAEIENSDVLSGWNCLPTDSILWFKNRIAPISTVKQIDCLHESCVLNVSPISQKELYEMKLWTGQKFQSSKDHRVFVRTCPLDKYTKLTLGNKTNAQDELLTVEQLQERLKTHAVFVKQQLRANHNKDVPDLSPEQLYLLGLIYTDGTLKDKNHITDGFTIFQSDKELLEELPLASSKLVGPYKDNYCRHISYKSVSSGVHLIYENGKKRLNLEALSMLSAVQFKHFLSGLLDGDGGVSGNAINFCNFIGDIPTLSQLCFWNGIMNTIQGRGTLMFFPYLFKQDLFLRKNKKRWDKLDHKLIGLQTKTSLLRESSQKAKLISYKIIGHEALIRVENITSTGLMVDMMDIETDKHEFIAQGLKVHNSSWFDMPYIYMRLLNVMGPNWANKLSFPNAKPPRIKEVEKFKRIQKTIELFGRVSLDYLELFIKLEQEKRPSNTLEAISEELLPHLKKLEYEGSLHDLYRDDFAFFVRYNIRDTEILKGFDERLKYIQFTVDFSHAACGLPQNILGTIKLTELAIINHCHYEMKTIVPDSNNDKSGGKFAGAFVLDPVVGMHDQVSGVDIKSLYPSTMRSLNISPERIIGQFIERNKAHELMEEKSDASLTLEYEDGSRETRTCSEWQSLLVASKWAISGYGTVFDQNKPGFLTDILTDWFNKRIEYQKKIKTMKAELKGMNPVSMDAKKLEESIDYWDKLQYVMKIRLNSIYGACGNEFFKFYDIRMAESVTRSGRAVLLHMVRKTAELLDGKYQWPSPSTLYSDTDSCYFATHGQSEQEALTIARTLCDEVNKSFPQFMAQSFLCTNEYDKLITAEQEIVAEKAIFISKKYYILKLTNKNGRSINEIKIMGHPIKKTTIPKKIRQRLIPYIEMLMNGVPWAEIGKALVGYKDELKKASPIELGAPQGLNTFEEYNNNFKIDPNTKLTGPASAAIFWNKCLEDYKDLESPMITSGMKIKTFYLTKMFGRFKSIAAPGDMKRYPDWFLENFVHLIDKDKQIEKLIDKTMANILEAIGKRMPTKKTLLVDELVEY